MIVSSQYPTSISLPFPIVQGEGLSNQFHNRKSKSTRGGDGWEKKTRDTISTVLMFTTGTTLFGNLVLPLPVCKFHLQCLLGGYFDVDNGITISNSPSVRDKLPRSKQAHAVVGRMTLAPSFAHWSWYYLSVR